MANPTVLQGALGVEDVLSDKKARDVTPGLQRLYKNLGVIFRIFNALPKDKAAQNPKVEWLRKDHLPRWSYLTTNVSESGTAGATVTLIPAHSEGGSADTERFKVGDIVEVPGRADNTTTLTNIGVITTVNTDVSIVVDPIGFASNDESTDLKFVATKTNDKIHIVSDASEEYSQKPTAKVPKDTQEWNYIGFKRAPYIIGNIQMDQKNYSGPERAERREDTYRDIRIQSEEDLIHGRRYYRDGTNGRQYFMGGIKRYISEGGGSNVLSNWSAGLTEADWDEYLVKGPMQAGIGSNRRFLFASDDLFLKINSFAKAKERVMGQVNMFGLAFTKYLAPNNKMLYIYQHELLVEEYAGAGLILDPEYLRIAGYGTQGTMRLLTNIQENDRAGIADEWQIIYTIKVPRTEPHGWITA